jgi:predicted nucleotidyltransferase
MTKQEKLVKYCRLGLDKIKAGQMDAQTAFSLLTWLRVAETLPEDSDQFNLIMSWFENEMLEAAAE